MKPNIYKSGRTEDGIIARTWRMFVENPTEPDVLLRLPMTKVLLLLVTNLTTLTETMFFRTYLAKVTCFVIQAAACSFR